MKLDITASKLRLNIYKINIKHIENIFDETALKLIAEYSELDSNGNFLNQRSKDLFSYLNKNKSVVPIELAYDDSNKKYFIVDGHHRIAVIKTKFDNMEIPAIIYSKSCKNDYESKILTKDSEFEYNRSLNFSDRLRKCFSRIKCD